MQKFKAMLHVQTMAAIEALDPGNLCTDYWAGKHERERAAAGMPAPIRAGAGRRAGAPRRRGGSKRGRSAPMKDQLRWTQLLKRCQSLGM